MVNEERLDAVLGYVHNHSEKWRQDEFAQKTECDTCYCFAGFGIQMYGTDAEKEVLAELSTMSEEDIDYLELQEKIFAAAQRIFEISVIEASALFYWDNTFRMLERLVQNICQRDPDVQLRLEDVPRKTRN